MLSILAVSIGVAVLIWFAVTLAETRKTSRRNEETLQELLELLRHRSPPDL